MLDDVLDDVVAHGVAGQGDCIGQDGRQHLLAHMLQGAVLQQPLHHPVASTHSLRSHTRNCCTSCPQYAGAPDAVMER